MTTVGRPSISVKCRFITGNSASARTTANPMRWVKEIFPPRVRRSWLLITRRLSASSFAGTARTDVAVGTSSDASMFFTTIDAAPRNGVVVPSSTAGAGRAAFEALPAAGGFSGAGRAGAATAAVPFAWGVRALRHLARVAFCVTSFVRRRRFSVDGLSQRQPCSGAARPCRCRRAQSSASPGR